MSKPETIEFMGLKVVCTPLEKYTRNELLAIASAIGLSLSGLPTKAVISTLENRGVMWAAADRRHKPVMFLPLNNQREVVAGP